MSLVGRASSSQPRASRHAQRCRPARDGGAAGGVITCDEASIRLSSGCTNANSDHSPSHDASRSTKRPMAARAWADRRAADRRGDRVGLPARAQRNDRVDHLAQGRDGDPTVASGRRPPRPDRRRGARRVLTVLGEPWSAAAKFDGPSSAAKVQKQLHHLTAPEERRVLGGYEAARRDELRAHNLATATAVTSA
jgi:hypothetical protein